MASRRIEDLKPEIQPFVRKFLEEANKVTAPWMTFITDGFRTPQEQQDLYEQGRTKPGSVVTNAKGLPACESNHCKGVAVDVAFQKDGKLSYDANLYGKIVPIAKELGASWGGDWSFPDKPHFEWTGQLPPIGDTKPMTYTIQDIIDALYTATDGRTLTPQKEYDYWTPRLQTKADLMALAQDWHLSKTGIPELSAKINDLETDLRTCQNKPPVIIEKEVIKEVKIPCEEMTAVEHLQAFFKKFLNLRS